MKNWVQNGDFIDITSAGALAAGSFFIANGLRGVVTAGVTGAGQQTTVATRGVFTLAKATGEYWAVGALLYWDAGNSRFTTTVGSNTLAGFAAAAAVSADTTGKVAVGIGTNT
jgi:predicted RecA/RadA family phage recombinase